MRDSTASSNAVKDKEQEQQQGEQSAQMDSEYKDFMAKLGEGIASGPGGGSGGGGAVAVDSDGDSVVCRRPGGSKGVGNKGGNKRGRPGGGCD